MIRHAIVRVFGCAVLLAVPGTLRTAAQTQKPMPILADVIYYNANVITMDDAMPTAQAVALQGKTILEVGTSEEILRLKGSRTQVTDLRGKTIVPGFIDAHSHLATYGYFNDPSHWVDVSSVNMFFKPLPGTSGCKSATDYQRCFIPVRSQDDVIDRLKKAVVDATASNASAVMAFNYDPSRLGPSKGCSGFGFTCPNFENGTALATLDAISPTLPIFVESESGHVAYVNSPGLKMLKICGAYDGDDCKYWPQINREVETKLARMGQLDEDLTFWATSMFQGLIFKDDPAAALAGVRRAAAMYASRGFTLTQEGAANTGLIDIYNVVTREPDFPTAAAMLVYDYAADNFQKTIDMANEAKPKIAGAERLFIAALKTFADGSPQAYTGFFGTPYFTIYPPFTSSEIFKQQPYVGLPDTPAPDIQNRLVAAHQAGYPLVIHQNGSEAIAGAVAALQQAQQQYPSPGLRDVVLHAPMITQAQMQTIKALNNVTVSFLMDNIQFWGQPLCQQVLGAARAVSVYPAAAATRTGLHVTMHHDTPVTPPDPLFAMWVAKTRQTQDMPWYPKSSTCPRVFDASSAISIRDGLKAFTIDAAWQYNRESTLGSITAGKTADLTILSDNPLQYENNPDGLLKITVMATVSQGRYFDHAATPKPLRGTAPE